MLPQSNNLNPQKPKTPESPALNILNLIFVLLIVLPVVSQHGKAIDAAHAQAAAHFRSGEMLVGGLGLIGVFLYRQFGPKPPPTPISATIPPIVSPPIPPTITMPGAGSAPSFDTTPVVGGSANPWDQHAFTAPTVTQSGVDSAVPNLTVYYQNRLPIALRCEFYFLFRSLMGWTGLAFMPMLAVITLIANALSAQPESTPYRLMAIMFAWPLIFVAILYFSIHARFAQNGGVRNNATALTKDGIHDIMPEKTNFIPWSAVRKVRITGSGDIHILHGMAGLYIPREAFPVEAERDRFVQAASLLKETRGAAWKEALPPPVESRMPPPVIGRATEMPTFDLD